ncbi:hypothetical protein VPH35_059654 [Triticum aestivum]
MLVLFSIFTSTSGASSVHRSVHFRFILQVRSFSAHPEKKNDHSLPLLMYFVVTVNKRGSTLEQNSSEERYPMLILVTLLFVPSLGDVCLTIFSQIWHLSSCEATHSGVHFIG